MRITINTDQWNSFEGKIKCCGCSACYAICPQEAIEMVSDEEGFFYPMINDKKCIKCSLCVKVCPIDVTLC